MAIFEVVCIFDMYIGCNAGVFMIHVVKNDKCKGCLSGTYRVVECYRVMISIQQNHVSAIISIMMDK